MTKNINFFNFHRQGFMKSLKKKLDLYNTLCRLKITKSDTESERNNVNFSDIVSKTLQKPETFSTGNFYYLLSLIQEHYDFLEEFRKSVLDIKLTDILKNNHNIFLLRQKESIEKVSQNFFTPKMLDEDTIKKIIEKQKILN